MSRPARFSLVAAFKCAGLGLGLLVHGRNARLQIGVAIAAVALGYVFRLAAGEWAAVAISIAGVLSLEAVNTAIERVVDLASPGYNDLARDAKDLAAGAVLIASVGSVIVGLIIFVPHILRLL